MNNNRWWQENKYVVVWLCGAMFGMVTAYATVAILNAIA